MAIPTTSDLSDKLDEMHTTLERIERLIKQLRDETPEEVKEDEGENEHLEKSENAGTDQT